MTDSRPISVSAVECAEIRQRRREGEKLTTIADDLGRTGTPVSLHSRGECRHDPAVVGVPVTTDQPLGEGPVTSEECAEIRRRRRDGETGEEVADILGRDEGTVSRHARGNGRCSHDPEEVGPPVAATITPEVCAVIRERRHDGETVEAIADDLGKTEATVSRHSVGGDGCNHIPEEVGAPVTKSKPSTPSITAEECKEIRRRRRAGKTLEEVAAALNRSSGAVSRHATGGCDHDPEVVGQPVTGRMSMDTGGIPVTAAECAAIRARRRAGQTLADVAEDLDRGQKTISNHSTGSMGCDHDPEVVGPPVSGRTPSPE